MQSEPLAGPWKGHYMSRKFRVSGADRVTGQEVRITVEADNEEDALNAPEVRGKLYVSRIHDVTTLQTVIGQAPEDEAAEAYPGVRSSARVVHWGSDLLRYNAAISVVGGVILFIFGVFASPALLPWGIALFVSGVFSFVFAALLRLLAHTCEAIRDIAIWHRGASRD